MGGDGKTDSFGDCPKGTKGYDMLGAVASPAVDPIAILAGGIAVGIVGAFKGTVAAISGAAEERATGAIGSGALRAMERQLANDGPNAVRKTIRTMTKRIAEHEVKISDALATGGHTSSMETELSAFRDIIRAARKVLGHDQ